MLAKSLNRPMVNSNMVNNTPNNNTVASNMVNSNTGNNTVVNNMAMRNKRTLLQLLLVDTITRKLVGKKTTTQCSINLSNSLLDYWTPESKDLNQIF